MKIESDDEGLPRPAAGRRAAPPSDADHAQAEVLDSAGMTPGGAAAMLAHLSPLQRARLLSAMRDEDKRHAMLDCMDDESKAAAVADAVAQCPLERARRNS